MAAVYSIADKKVQETLKAGAAITDGIWYGNHPVISTASGVVKVFGDKEITFKSHAGSVNALAIHPCGEILASVGVDKSFVFYDLPGGKAATQVYTDSGINCFQFIDTWQSLTFDRTHHCCIPSRWTYFCSRGRGWSNQDVPCQDWRKRSKF